MSDVNNETQETHHLNHTYSMPAYIFEDPDLETGAKMLYALLSSLTCNKGFSWPSDIFLAEKMKTTDRAIRYWLKSLKEKKYIIIDSEKKGLKWHRKIWINAEFKRIFTKGNMVPIERKCISASNGNVFPSDSSRVPITLSNTNILTNTSKERVGASPQTPHPPDLNFFIYEGKFSNQKRVKLKLHLYEKLVKEFGQNRINDYLEKLDAYADTNPKNFKKYECHASVIRRWIVKDIEEKKSNQKGPARPASFENVQNSPAYEKLKVGSDDSLSEEEKTAIREEIRKFKEESLAKEKAKEGKK